MPADVTGTELRRDHIAAANCDRAELWVHTNTTRGAASAAAGSSPVNVAGTTRT